ncbi:MULTISPECIES: glycerophosphodiester phosphodiesterase family protein [Microbispora]|uniref:Glycerophosphodiester phosphodiesterase family protein n=1 Tax=Microbispora hainanensis TaxID=568844 RepID=A0ABZ1SJI4_9ACTN|nr:MULTISPECIES: glycerophosphodiester phosphodiesterase family protein [Microbispora]
MTRATLKATPALVVARARTAARALVEAMGVLVVPTALVVTRAFVVAAGVLVVAAALVVTRASVVAVRVFVIAMALVVAMTATPALAQAEEPPPCPLVIGHGGYPKSTGAKAKDLIRQPNVLRAVDDQASWGADGVEADVQLTRRGTKAVMWHNRTTNGLTGPLQEIREIGWAEGPGNLRDRRIARGPYAGERVPTLREWLDHVRARGLLALLEIKKSVAPVLADPVHGAAAWREIIDPIVERQDAQPILVYSRDKWIKAELAERLPDHLRGSAAKWTDGVKWDEPPPPWQLNEPRWQAVLDEAANSVMTSHTADYRAWLDGRCHRYTKDV